jgi:phenylpropionate dioxygenase-like ring-hydroxylating dioxygenase large terminal subunit
MVLDRREGTMATAAVRSSNENLPFPAEQQYPRNQWYVAAFSRELDGGTPLRRVLLGVPVVLYLAESGAAVAMVDRCPHRGSRLSMGKRNGDNLQCGYHGIEFGIDGKCVHIPSQRGNPGAMSVTTYPVVEKWQWIWIWMGDREKADEALIPDHEWMGLGVDGLEANPFVMVQIGCNYQFFNENLLDATHLSYVHFGTLDNGEIAEMEHWVEQNGQSLVIGRREPNVRYEGQIARYFRADASKTYDRTHHTEAFLPSTHVAKQWLQDVNDPASPPLTLYAINALTPRDMRNTYTFHVQVANYPDSCTPDDLAGVNHILGEDIVVLESMQQDYDRYRSTQEISVAADAPGIRARRMIKQLLDAEAMPPR